MAQSSTTMDGISVNNQRTSTQTLTTTIGGAIINKPAPTTSATKSNVVRFNVRDCIATFTGRKEIIHQLHERIEANQWTRNQNVALQAIAICGMGGLGKTEIIRKYIQIYHSNYTNIIWINAEKYSEAKTCFIHLAKILNISTMLSKGTPGEYRHLADRIYSHLVKGRTLLVFDNMQLISHDAIKQSLFPASSVTKAPDVILTTRDKLNDYHTIDLGGLSERESYAFLVSSLALQKTYENYTAASEIYTLSEGLPIVLQQVIGVMTKENEVRKTNDEEYSLTEYATNVNVNLHNLTITRTADLPVGDSVFSIFQTSFERLMTFEHGKLALHCLDIMSLLNPDNIPSTLLKHLINENDFTKAMSLLIEYNLVTMDENEDVFIVHRMIQAMRRHSTNFLKIRDSSLKSFFGWMSTQSLLSAELNAFKQFLDTIVLNDRNIFNVLHNGIRLHETVHMHSPDEFLVHDGFQDTLAKTLESVGRYDEAKQIYQVLLQERTKALGEIHPNTLNTKQSLALVYQNHGNYEEAEKLYHFLLQEETKALGGSHPKILTIQKNLTNVYMDQKKYEHAERMYEIVLQKETKALGESHPDILTTKNNLANLYNMRGKYARAEELYLFLFREETKMLSGGHTDNLTTKYNLANVYKSQGKYEQAEQLFQLVLHERAKTRGESHPITLTTKNDLANVYYRQGKYEEAEELYHFVVQERTKVLGESHINTLTTANNLANVYMDQGKYEQAEEMFQAVLQEWTKVLGESHPDTLTTKYNLAHLTEIKVNISRPRNCSNLCFKKKRKCWVKVIRTPWQQRKLQIVYHNIWYAKTKH